MPSTTFKTGYLPSPPDDRDIMADALYGALSLPAPPPKTSWRDKMPKKIPMFANDRLGDCTCATIGHLEILWTAQHGPPTIFTDAQIIAEYNKVNGGRDQGANPRDVLKVMHGRTKNSSFAGQRIAAYARLDNSVDEIRQAAWTFGGAYICLSLPNGFQDLSTWANTSPRGARNPANGHAINVVDYDEESFTVATWGQYVRMSLAYWKKYGDESWLLMSPQWWGNKALSPSRLLVKDAAKAFKSLAA